ncbi:uncharacterized protein TRIADDRAFT_19305 [Trichoplax adhaerens]|uniref:Cilia- and flagella-associated protein 61 N-terminal domain-containing protein n=1 Tax=Trichoplax adhaerens TaxID=10228 RepID=B3RKX7_TRIAD|nr:hypothetical protein TRIADDRAFT_19305 [Trichoplax adhaerens]EDV28663.1 hypothetical protein TRIADDRAFT_19305 [Trichoplax adhaerens]|eukprot:XP_002107865.1 hypothetical protein TRIADDRAFT_19305 [Trichoplax adhaerens]
MASTSNTGELDINVRRTEISDATKIMQLFNSSTEKIFGRVNVVHLIEKSVLSITITDDQETMIGQASFYDYPNIQSHVVERWEDLIISNPKLAHCSPLNTLFLHHFVALEGYAKGVAKEIFKTFFNATPYVHYCLLSVKKGTAMGDSLNEIFSPTGFISKLEGSEYEILICHRHDHCPTLHIRPAKVEDHDDLVPIFNRQSEVLKETYGDYFLAELIEAQNENNKCIVVDVKGTAVGFMSLSKNVNIDILTSCFELSPFNGLRRPPEFSNAENDDGKQASETEEPTDTPAKTSSTITIGTDTSDVHFKSKLADVYDDDDGNQCTENLKYFLLQDIKGIDRASSAPVYQGTPSVICIQLYCIDEKYETRSLDFITAAFDFFPNVDYCVITVPHLVPEFPLLQHFTRVTPKPRSTFPQELYLFHHYGLINSMKVRNVKVEDVETISKLVQNTTGKDMLLRDINLYNMARRDPDGTDIKAYVAVCLNQPVGVAVIRKEENIEYIRSHYNIEDFIYYNHYMREEHGHLHHFVLNPIYSHFSKYFIQEILRLSKKNAIYYPIYPPYVQLNETKPHSLASCLANMVPIRARRQVQYVVDELKHNAPSNRILQQMDNYMLFHINKKLVMEPKITINARIIVVGASDVGVSFLEKLIFSPHMRFNNLKLISPNGIPGQLKPNSLRNQFLADSYCYTQQNYDQIALHSWVSVIKGEVKAINRKSKYVVVGNDTKVMYDHLILCTGCRYQYSCPTGVNVDENVVNNETTVPYRYFGPKYSNIFTLNDQFDCQAFLDWLEEQDFINRRDHVCIYGSTIDAYTTVQALLEYGIEGSRIILIHPPAASPINCFNNSIVEEVVLKGLKEAGITVHHDLILARWEIDESNETVVGASFTSDNKPVQISCSAFICFSKLGIDYSIFKAINDSCLVYDGRLVIDSSYRTNDPCIWAAGPMTKFARRYHAEAWTHANFNSKEVGLKLAETVLSILDPMLESEAPDAQPDIIPVYNHPKTFLTKLPGNYTYLHTGKPSLNISLDSMMVQPNYGHVLVTGSHTVDTQGYFRLHINQYRSVETVTCLSKNEIKVNNLLSLYGIHEKFLNNVLSRYKEGLVSDFYQYFNEPWATAIFHDRFHDFREEIKEILFNKQVEEESDETFELKIRKLLDEDFTFTKKELQQLGEDYIKSCKSSTEKRLLTYLSYNTYHLPMYAKPGIV